MAAQWITTEDAQTRLGVKLQTLYAYASRGLIAHRSDSVDPRRSLYALEDVTKLAARKQRGRRATVAHEAMSFGEPVMISAITTIADNRLYYRGHDAVALAETATLEDTARLLWDWGDDPFAGLKPCSTAFAGQDSRARAFELLAHRAATDPIQNQAAPKSLAREAASLISDLVDAICGQPRTGPLHERLAYFWQVDAATADAIRRALVLTADHELNASTFAARVTASTGATLAAGALAGLAALSGPLHGGMTNQVAAFFAQARRDPHAVAAARVLEGLDLPGFGHQLYPLGDPRAAAIHHAVGYADDIEALLLACEAAARTKANIDFALVAMGETLGLPADAPFTLFTIARAVGWIAHMLEQRASGAGLIRPRARYVGAPPRRAAEPSAPEG